MNIRTLILNYLKSKSEPVSLKEIREFLKNFREVTPATLRYHLKILEKEGLVEKVGRGKYQATLKARVEIKRLGEPYSLEKDKETTAIKLPIKRLAQQQRQLTRYKDGRGALFVQTLMTVIEPYFRYFEPYEIPYAFTMSLFKAIRIYHSNVKKLSQVQALLSNILEAAPFTISDIEDLPDDFHMYLLAKMVYEVLRTPPNQREKKIEDLLYTRYGYKDIVEELYDNYENPEYFKFIEEMNKIPKTVVLYNTLMLFERAFAELGTGYAIVIGIEQVLELAESIYNERRFLEVDFSPNEFEVFGIKFTKFDRNAIGVDNEETGRIYILDIVRKFLETVKNGLVVILDAWDVITPRDITEMLRDNAGRVAIFKITEFINSYQDSANLGDLIKKLMMRFGTVYNMPPLVILAGQDVKVTRPLQIKLRHLTDLAGIVYLWKKMPDYLLPEPGNGAYQYEIEESWFPRADGYETFVKAVETLYEVTQHPKLWTMLAGMYKIIRAGMTKDNEIIAFLENAAIGRYDENEAIIKRFKLKDTKPSPPSIREVILDGNPQKDEVQKDPNSGQQQVSGELRESRIPTRSDVNTNGGVSNNRIIPGERRRNYRSNKHPNILDYFSRNEKSRNEVTSGGERGRRTTRGNSTGDSNILNNKENKDEQGTV